MHNRTGIFIFSNFLILFEAGMFAKNGDYYLDYIRTYVSPFCGNLCLSDGISSNSGELPKIRNASHINCHRLSETYLLNVFKPLTETGLSYKN